MGHEKEIHDALHEDLGKSSFESYMCETGLVLSELTHMIQHIEEYAEEQDVHTPISQFAARSYKKPVPYGVVLIMSPWNYPFLLSLDPLIDALAAGNTVILKPSAYSPSTTAMIELLSGTALNQNLSQLSPAVAKKTPVCSISISIIFSLPEARTSAKKLWQRQVSSSLLSLWNSVAKAPVSWIVNAI